MKNIRVAVLGGGSWGATIAAHLNRNPSVAGVRLWEYYPDRAARLARTRRLKTLPALRLPPSVLVTSDLAAACEGAHLVLFIVPSQTLRATARAARPHLHPQASLVNLSKGVEIRSLKRMTQVLAEECPPWRRRLAAVHGPSHAEEVCLGMPTAVTAASRNPGLLRTLLRAFSSPSFHVFFSNDMTGVELGGALKNVIAIAAGICDGLGLGDNTKAALLTRGLAEITRLGRRLGARPATFAGLSGMGDLIVTALSRHSRNRLLGEKIGRGKSLRRALKEMTMVAEGVETSRAVRRLSRRLRVSMPICTEVHKILFDGKDPKRSVRELMARPPSQE